MVYRVTKIRTRSSGRCAYVVLPIVLQVTMNGLRDPFPVRGKPFSVAAWKHASKNLGLELCE